MKKFLRITLTALLLLTIPAVCSAAQSIDYAAYDAADELNQLGLFAGTGINEDGTPNYSLERVPTRAEAVVMLVKLLGRDADAKAGSWSIPFTDVEDWAKPYVGFAYSRGYTAGVDKTLFGSNNKATAQMYLTFILKALNYNEGTDFLWDEASLFSDAKGITNGEYNDDSHVFTRGDIAKISVKALNTYLRQSEEETILDRLLNREIITYEQANHFKYMTAAAVFSSVPTYEDDGSFYFSGEGEGSIRHMDIPEGQYYCVCEYEGKGTFRADLYYGQGESDFWIIGNLMARGTYYAPLYEKYFFFDMAGKELTNTHIEINAAGKWKIRFRPFREMNFDGHISGRGNYVSELFTADTENYVFHATHNGSTLFNVYVVKYNPNDGNDFYRNAVNDYGSKEYKELLNLEKGSQYYFSIIGDGDWTIELANAVSTSSSTTIDHANHIYSGTGNELITGINLPEGQWYAECVYGERKNTTQKGFEGKLFFDVPGKKYWPIEGSVTGTGSAFFNKCALFDMKGESLTNGALQIHCNGSWTVTFKKVRISDKTYFSGDGAAVTEAFSIPSDTVQFKFVHNGTQEYRVRILEYETSSRNTRAQVVFNGNGQCNETTTLVLNPEKHYYISVDYGGSWSISVNH